MERNDIAFSIAGSVQDAFEAGLRQRSYVDREDTEVVRSTLPRAQVARGVLVVTGRRVVPVF